MDMPEAFKAYLKIVLDSTMGQAAADCGEGLEAFGLSVVRKAEWLDIDAYLAYVLQHPDRLDKASELWKALDRQGKFPGVRKGLRLFEKTQAVIRQTLR